MRSDFFKHIIFYIALLVGVSNAQSQFGLGLIGGLNHSSLDIANQAENTTLIPRNGIIIGASSRYNFSTNIYLSGHLIFIEKGQDAEWRQFVWDYTEAQLNYLELPIYFNYRFILDNVKPKIFCGAYIGYLVKATGRIKINDEINEVDIIDGYNKIDFGIDVGVGIDFSFFDNYDIFLDFCYSHGLVNISSEGNVKNRGYQIMLGIMYYINSAI